MKKCPPESTVGQLIAELCVIVLKSANQQPTLTADLQRNIGITSTDPQNSREELESINH